MARSQVGPGTRIRSPLRRLVDPVGARTLAAALVILAVYGLWQVFRWGGHQHQALIGDLAFFLPNAAGGYCAWRVSQRTDLGHPTIPGLAAALYRHLALPAR